MGKVNPNCLTCVIGLSQADRSSVCNFITNRSISGPLLQLASVIALIALLFAGI